MQTAIKTGYYGINLKDAYDNCMSDAGTYDNEKTYKIIGARLLLTNIAVGFRKELCEYWEFEIVLIF